MTNKIKCDLLEEMLADDTRFEATAKRTLFDVQNRLMVSI